MFFLFVFLILLTSAETNERQTRRNCNLTITSNPHKCRGSVSFKVNFTGWCSDWALLSDDSLSQCEGLTISSAPAVWSNVRSVGARAESFGAPVTIHLG